MASVPEIETIEIEPFVLFRVEGGEARCATWRLEQGHEAVALFLSEHSAHAYCLAAGLGGEWQIRHVGREPLLALLRQCVSTGIVYAVLDPTGSHAKRIFDLPRILRTVAETSA